MANSCDLKTPRGSVCTVLFCHIVRQVSIPTQALMAIKMKSEWLKTEGCRSCDPVKQGLGSSDRPTPDESEDQHDDSKEDKWSNSN